MVPRIRQIQIQSFRSIERAVVDLEPFTALVGPNGAGKSNFVDALVFMQESLSHGIENALRTQGAALFYPRWMPPVEIRAGFRVLLDLPEGGSADYAFEISRKGFGRFHVARERCTVRSPGHKDSIFEVADGKFLHPISGIRPKMEPDRLALYAASATEELRPVYDFLSTMRVYSIDPLRIVSSEKTDSGEVLEPSGRNAAAVLRSLEERSPQVHERINRLLAQAVQDVGRVGTHTQGQEVRLQFWKDLHTAAPVEFYTVDMSDGTLRILALLLALYQTWHPSLVAIEEPEATVHPAAAELITQVLADAARDRQVLITTHSPDILDSKEIRDDQIRVVTMEQGRTIIAPMSKASRQAVREHLYTPGELLRVGELGQDVEEAKRAAESLEIFESPAPSPS